MRTTLFFILVFLLNIKLSAQNNLQFNQVKLVGSTAETVPAGKVWKIESAPLTAKDGIQSIPRFLMGTDTILIGCCDPYTSSQLENVVSVKLEWAGTNQSAVGSPYTLFTGNGATNVSLSLEGTKKPGQPFSQNINFSNIPGISNQDEFSSLGSNLVLNSGSNQISSFKLNFSVQPVFVSNYGYLAYWNYRLLVTFILANGNSFSYTVYSYPPGNSNVSGTTIQNISINGPVIPSETKTRNIATQFPIWIPAGIAVKTLSNIGKLSILEFNVTQ